MKTITHSSNQKLKIDTDIYLVDSYGISSKFYGLTNVAFVGGSLIAHGGQNPLEAARYNCQILHGPNIWNFSEIYNLLRRLNVSQKITNIRQIVKKISIILNNKKKNKDIQFKLNSLSKNILKLTLIEINNQIIK